ncbi:MAG TPA: YhcN/YlaJ family sporulation lipoprotein [Bacillota bacterium]|nr:YhcN/YlaJ family sporulation lipoprotein [Bacillota bacterium]
MLNWKTWLGVSALSFALMGCGVNQGPGATTKSTGMDQSYGQTGTTARSYVSNTADLARRNYNGNANVNNVNPQTYGSNSLYKNHNTMGVRGTTNDYSTGVTSFGYAAYHKTDMHTQQASTYYVDRNVLARTIATVVNTIPGVQESSVLVTDQDIFVGMNGVKDTSTFNQARLAAWGVSPRYYRLHYTADPNTINEVKTLVANSNNRKPFDDTKLQSILKNKTVDSQNVINNHSNSSTGVNNTK